jgi:type IV pilus assembly protein PilB
MIRRDRGSVLALLVSAASAIAGMWMVLTSDLRARTNRYEELWKPPAGIESRLKSKGCEVEKLYVGEGCSRCRNTGNSGRIGIYELFTLDDELRDLVVAQAPLQHLRKAAREHGMRTLLEDGLAKVREGITSADEVLRVTE